MATTVESIRISLPPEMTALVRAAVDSGEYASPSEVVGEALRVWKLKRTAEELDVDELKRLVDEGIGSGPGVDAELVFSRLRAKYARMAGEDQV